MIFLGIDTSNYTTSVALCGAGGVLAQKRRLLPVKPGSLGLRQSDALFAHVKALPALCRELGPLDGLAAVGVSGFPRRAEGSYMPCFLAGASLAASLAALYGVPLYIFSHQEGHVAAGVFGSGMDPDPAFSAVHLSGGTLELLSAKTSGGLYSLEKLGGAGDITCGQLIDRCGVKLGLDFPCGAELEKLAKKSAAEYRINIPERDGALYLSGLENRFDALRAAGKSPGDLAGFVFACVVAAAKTLTENVKGQLLFSGGVSSSSILKAAFADRPETYFSPPEYSCDNAAGIALMARASYLAGKPGDSTERLRME